MKSARRFIALGVALGLLAAASASAQRPPTDLKRVNDHWSAWDPPTTFPEGAQVYIIQRTDTLWDLSGRFYGNPYLWPQLWEQNQYILDAHWIYPGDPLVVGFEIEEVEDLAEIPEEPLEPTAPPTDPWDLRRALGPPVPLGAESDIYCTGFVGDLDEGFEFSITGSEYQALSPNLNQVQGRRIEGIYGIVDAVKVGLDRSDIVYLDGGRVAGMRPGMLLTSVMPMEVVRHPHTREVVGRFYRYDGRVRVLSVQDDQAIGEIVHSCRPIEVGSALTPFEPVPVPLARRSPLRPASDPVPAQALRDAPVILRSDGSFVTLGQGHVVYIDRGEAHEVVPGDIYTIYRENREGFPPVVLGELAVLSVHGRSSVAKILESRFPIYAGDLLDPK